MDFMGLLRIVAIIYFVYLLWTGSSGGRLGIIAIIAAVVWFPVIGSAFKTIAGAIGSVIGSLLHAI